MKTGGISFSSKTFWIFDLDGTLTIPVLDFDFIRKELDIPYVSDILGYLDCLPEAEASIRRSRLHQIELELAHKATPSSTTPLFSLTVIMRKFWVGRAF